MSNDRYQKIRDALAMGPTPGPWGVVNKTDVFTPLGARNAAGVKAADNNGWHVSDCDKGPTYTEEGKEDLPYRERQANATLIAACDPGTIRGLLDERDALVAENEALRAEVERLHEQLRLVAADQVNAEAEANDAHAENKRMAKEVTNEWNQSVGPWSGASR